MLNSLRSLEEWNCLTFRRGYLFFAAFFLAAFFGAAFFLVFFLGSPPLSDPIFSFSFLSDWAWSKDLENSSDPLLNAEQSI